MEGIANITKIPELKRRLLFTVMMIAVYRIGVHIPTPGVDGAALQTFWDQTSGTLFDYLNLFSGGALERFSIFALGIMPYISASIILQLLTVVIPHLERLQKEGDAGRRKINMYTRYGTIPLCLIQSFGIATWLESSPGELQLVLNPGFYFKVMTVLTLTAGTVFIMWLGEQITERGIGNGISIIIYAGIVAGFVPGLATTIEQVGAGDIGALVAILLVAFMVLVCGGIIFCERGQRRIPVHYAKRMVGRKMYQGQNTYLPLRMNTAGVIPPIFASSLLMFPATISTLFTWKFLQGLSDSLGPGGLLYNVITVILIIFFCYFYTAIMFNPDDVADNMKKSGGYVPGIRPGQNTALYIDRVLSRLTLIGGIYVSIVCIIPFLLINQLNVSFYFGGTSILIVVGVALDTVAQIESHLLTRNYDGLVGSKNARVKGRRG
jgi:preprotein translocase subunit SecY